MELLLGDCLYKLKELKDNSVDSIVTDPPYGLSFMGKQWDYDVPSQEIWEECMRVLKPGGHLLAFAGSRTYHRMAVRIEDAGFEIRDQIMWVYGSGFPKSHNIGKGVDKKFGNEREVVGEGGTMPIQSGGKRNTEDSSKFEKFERKTQTITEFYGKNDFIVSNCISIAFNRPSGSNSVYVNGMPIGDGQTFTINQNVGELDTTRYEIVFQGGASTNELYVVRVVPMDFNID